VFPIVYSFLDFYLNNRENIQVARKRIYEIARELGVSSKDLIAKLERMGMPGLKATNTVDDEECSLILNLYQEDVAAVKVKEERHKPRKGVPRAPIVSVLGHIDHGKTTLLDAIRDSHLTVKETGGITQTVGAYQADLHGQKITFIDTPGHKAFTGMRARGAMATDIAILVIAADDGIMAQTVEAIDHIQAAEIPMIVAINKIDKPNADLNKVMNDLAQRGLTPEDWGGDTITVPISAINNQGINELLEMILLVAEMEDLRSDPDGTLEASVIESHLSVGRGPVATTVINQGTIHQTDCIVAGSTYGRVRALINQNGKHVREATPGTVIEIVGLQGVPPAGTPIETAKNITRARQIAAGRAAKQLTKHRVRAEINVEDLFREAMEEEKLILIVKASSTGALEAIRHELSSITVDSIKLEFLHTGVGIISESDVLLASTVAKNCLVVGFGTKTAPKASKLANHEGVLILTYDIIYELVEEIERSLKKMVPPTYEEVKLGETEVRELFKIPGGVVAGCIVTAGKVTSNGEIHVVRDDEQLFTGKIASLRRFKKDAREVQSGQECGICIRGFDSIEVGDELIIFTLKEVEP